MIIFLKHPHFILFFKTISIYLLLFKLIGFQFTANPPLLGACLQFIPDVLLPNDDEMARSFSLVLSDQFVNSADPGSPSLMVVRSSALLLMLHLPYSGVSYRAGKMLCKIIAAHPSLRPMVVAQVAEFTATMWLQSEMDIQDAKLGGALDKVRTALLFAQGGKFLS